MPMDSRLLRPRATGFDPRSISGLALWLDAADTSSLYTTDAGPVTAVTAPTDISGCVGWWDASDRASMFDAASGGSQVAANGRIGRWQDKSGGGRHLLQSSTGNRPTLIETGFNGRPCVRGDGSEWMVCDGANIAASSITIFVVYRLGTWQTGVAPRANNMNLFHTDLPTTGMSNYGLRTENTSNLFDARIGDSDSNMGGMTFGATQANSEGVAALVTHRFRSSDAEQAIRLGGDVAASRTVSATHIPPTFGANVSALTGFQRANTADWERNWRGDIAEMVFFNTALSNAEVARVEAYLAAKWGISGVHAQATATSDPVGYWGDKSGNNRHATQATGANRPIRSAAANGKSVVAFDGTNQWMRTDRTTYAARSVFTVFRRTGALNNYDGFFGTQSGIAADYGGSAYAVAFGRESGWARSGAAAANLHYWTNNSSPNQLTLATKRGAEMPLADARNSSGGIVAAESTDQVELLYAEIAAATAVGNAWFLGTEPFSTARRYPCEVMECIVYDRAISTAERQRVERYLASKWGVALAPQVSNADAQDWVNRVYANGGTVSSTTASAVNTFCNAINAAGIRDRFYRLNLFCGTGLSACLVPLYRGPSLGGTQYGGTIDTNTGPFVSGDYNENAGLQSLTSTKYLNTGLATDAMPASVYESMHLSAWHGQTSAGVSNQQLIGVYNGTTDRWSVNIGLSTVSAMPDQARLGKANTLSSTTTIQGSRPSAFLLATRTSSTNLVLYRNAVSDGVLTTSTTGIASSSLPFFVFRANLSGTDFGDPGVCALRMYSIGDDMTQEQVTGFHAALSAFNAALGRTA